MARALRGSKGISPMVSYVLAILIAVIVLSGVALLVNGFYKTILEDEARRELTQVAAQTSSKITEIYSIAKASKASPSNSTAILLADLGVNLPDRVAGKRYQVTLVSANQISSYVSNVTLSGQNVTAVSYPGVAKIVAETTEEPFVLVEHDVPSLDVEIQGRSDVLSNSTLRYYRYNPNGTVVDTILFGDYSLVAQVVSVS